MKEEIQMKITLIEIEASPEDLAANRTAADACISALQRLADAICPAQYADNLQSEEVDQDD